MNNSDLKVKVALDTDEAFTNQLCELIREIIREEIKPIEIKIENLAGKNDAKKFIEELKRTIRTTGNSGNEIGETLKGM